MVLLDLFCGAGGAAKGYADAGFDVVGVDIEPQPHFPYRFIQGDAVAFLDKLRQTPSDWPDAIHASPPCQAWTAAQRIRQRDHPDLIAPTREHLRAMDLPYIIENVEGAPLIDPVMLCGEMFPELRVYRHRLFETSFPVDQPAHPKHTHKLTKMGRPPQPDEYMHVVGNFSGVQAARDAMGIDWMPRNALREAIPPAYTRYVARYLLDHIAGKSLDAAAEIG